MASRQGVVPPTSFRPAPCCGNADSAYAAIQKWRVIVRHAPAILGDKPLPVPELIGDPMEIALVRLANRHGHVDDGSVRVDELPFDPERRRMSVVIDCEDRHVLICKGAVEEVARVCENYQVDEDINPLIQLIRDDLMDEYRNLSAEGYRVLAIAYREFDRTKQTFSVADESAMILLGYIAFFDPAKDTAREVLHRAPCPVWFVPPRG